MLLFGLSCLLLHSKFYTCFCCSFVGVGLSRQAVEEINTELSMIAQILCLSIAGVFNLGFFMLIKKDNNKNDLNLLSAVRSLTHL